MEGKRPPGVMLYFAEMRPIFTLLDAAESGELLMKMMNYAEYGTDPDFQIFGGNPRLAAVWPLVQRMIDRDIEAYQVKCEKRKKAVEARWNREREAKEHPE